MNRFNTIQSKYPDNLKVSKTIPIYKNKDNKNVVINYRNISRCYHAKLMKYLERNKLIINAQHGFLPIRSTKRVLINTFISEALKSRQWAIALFIEQRRAFDSVGSPSSGKIELYRWVLRLTGSDIFI